MRLSHAFVKYSSWEGLPVSHLAKLSLIPVKFPVVLCRNNDVRGCENQLITRRHCAQRPGAAQTFSHKLLLANRKLAATYRHSCGAAVVEHKPACDTYCAARDILAMPISIAVLFRSPLSFPNHNVQLDSSTAANSPRKENVQSAALRLQIIANLSQNSITKEDGFSRCESYLYHVSLVLS